MVNVLKLLILKIVLVNFFLNYFEPYQPINILQKKFNNPIPHSQVDLIKFNKKFSTLQLICF